jgi:TonB family protein
MKARLRHSVPVHPLALGKDVRIKGVVVLELGVDSQGDVVCVQVLSGHPMLVAAAIDSVKQWKFKAGNQRTCGKLILALSTLEPNMGVKVLDAEPPTRQR